MYNFQKQTGKLTTYSEYLVNVSILPHYFFSFHFFSAVIFIFAPSDYSIKIILCDPILICTPIMVLLSLLIYSELVLLNILSYALGHTTECCWVKMTLQNPFNIIPQGTDNSPVTSENYSPFPLKLGKTECWQSFDTSSNHQETEYLMLMRFFPQRLKPLD